MAGRNLRTDASDLQRKAALRAENLLAQMGSPSVPLADADARTRMNFLGKPYASTFAVDSYPALGMANQAYRLAEDTKASNRKNAKLNIPKGGF